MKFSVWQIWLVVILMFIIIIWWLHYGNLGHEGSWKPLYFTILLIALLSHYIDQHSPPFLTLTKTFSSHFNMATLLELTSKLQCPSRTASKDLVIIITTQRSPTPHTWEVSGTWLEESCQSFRRLFGPLCVWSPHNVKFSYEKLSESSFIFFVCFPCYGTRLHHQSKHVNN